MCLMEKEKKCFSHIVGHAQIIPMKLDEKSLKNVEKNLILLYVEENLYGYYIKLLTTS